MAVIVSWSHLMSQRTWNLWQRKGKTTGWEAHVSGQTGKVKLNYKQEFPWLNEPSIIRWTFVWLSTNSICLLSSAPPRTQQKCSVQNLLDVTYDSIICWFFCNSTMFFGRFVSTTRNMNKGSTNGEVVFRSESGQITSVKRYRKQNCKNDANLCFI